MAEYVAPRTDAGRRAYQLLHIGYVVIPTIAGLDKFFHALTNWNQYLAPRLSALFGDATGTIMRGVGVVEIAAGLLVAVKPRIGGYVVAAWLLGIVANLLLYGGYYDIALRDLGLAGGGVALAQLATVYEERRAGKRAAVPAPQP